MVTAAALGDALGIPVHGVCSLDAIAARARRRPLLVVTDARRKEVYWARLRRRRPAHRRPARRGARRAGRAAAGLCRAAAGEGAGGRRAARCVGPRAAPVGLVAVAAERCCARAPAGPVGAAVPAPPRRRGTRRPQAGDCRDVTVAIGPLRAVATSPRCAELERLLFPGDDPWRERAFRDELRAATTTSPRGDEGRSLVGYARARRSGRAAEAEVHTIGVDPAHQAPRHRPGAAARRCSRWPTPCAAAVFLEVRTDNEAATRSTRARGSPWSGCAGATTGPAAPTPTPCGERDMTGCR